VVIHGGCWGSQYGFGDMGHICAAVTESGVAAWDIEYRRVGDAGGGWARGGGKVWGAAQLPCGRAGKYFAWLYTGGVLWLSRRRPSGAADWIAKTFAERPSPLFREPAAAGRRGFARWHHGPAQDRYGVR